MISPPVAKEISIAPMMERTDRHCRYFHRLLAPDVRLYTEMVVAQAVIKGDRQKLLRFDPVESPLALQLGGSDPALLAKAARIGEQWGYDEINLNIGCPSDRVQSGRFGACLMAEPEIVAASVNAMGEVVSIPVTVKTRIGIDDHDEYEYLAHFIETVAAAGCTMFIVHARKAILKGLLSPKENRSIPPLHYDVVYRLRQEFPELRIVINGGVRTTLDAKLHLKEVEGVMIGRQAYSDPYWLTELQGLLLPVGAKWKAPSRESIVKQMAEYAGRELSSGTRLHHISRHMLGLYSGQPGARAWRRFLSEGAVNPDSGPEILLESLRH
ncbi:MAG: tRNA dihydrouridine(20/20a) synthase DusA [Gammaproteobacteria bacterium]|nr:tRNA dihydrouridine(20/20a) synthase DusA [Gammaproteobacteria bacterium]MCP4832063.1 tRNA dihydrouridine(20/20a) synthase DusA [Gammaproteobacteria bacterium]MCP4928336.1 tRNA dihydrouridine(20/20a) synthase DusA [Gammaproteobacteria bacterium]